MHLAELNNFGPIQYVDEGDGPPVVLLHGLVMNHRVWDRVTPLLPTDFRYIRPVLPFGSHRIPLDPAADLSMRGMVHLVAEFLATLELTDVTLVHSDWGGGLFLTAEGLDHRVAKQIILPCEAFDNFPPGIAGRAAARAALIPGGLYVAGQQLRIGWLRRSRLLLGDMAKRPIDLELIREWTEPLLSNPRIRSDLAKCAGQRLDKKRLVRDIEALRRFKGEALVLWAPENRIMPQAHADRLAELLPRSELKMVDDSFVLCMLDQPEHVAKHMAEFLG